MESTLKKSSDLGNVTPVVEYMMRRALLLFLTDTHKGKVYSSGIDFLPVFNTSERNEYQPDFAPILLLLNLWVATEGLRTSILPRLKIPFTWEPSIEVVDEENVEGLINWIETFNRRVTEGDKYVVFRQQKIVSDKQAEFVVAVLKEYLAHSRVVLGMFENRSCEPEQTALKSMLRRINQVNVVVEEILRKYFQQYLRRNEREVRQAEKILTSLIFGPRVETVNLLKQYSADVGIKSPRGIFAIDAMEDLSRWRAQYLSCRVWNTDKVGFKVLQTSDLPMLFEIWVFHEFCLALSRNKLGTVIQRNFLARGATEPGFVFNQTHYVYFDSRRRIFQEVDPSEVFRGRSGDNTAALPKIHVEWFIRDNNDFSQSVVLDTKFSDWRSAEALKVLGYMFTFGVRRGVIVFREEFDPDSLGGKVVRPGLVEVTLSNGKFWAITLKPDKKSEKGNSLRLNALVKALFVHSYH